MTSTGKSFVATNAGKGIYHKMNSDSNSNVILIPNEPGHFEKAHNSDELIPLLQGDYDLCSDFAGVASPSITPPVRSDSFIRDSR